MDRAARIAIAEARRFLDANESMEMMTFVCFSQPAKDTYLSAMDEAFSGPSP